MLAVGAAAVAVPVAAGAQLQVQVTTHDVDEDDPPCFLHGTLSAQDIDVTNTGAAPVTASLFCTVPSALLRVAAITPPTQIAPGATARMNCSLFDFQDPPVDGAMVGFDVEVNGQTTNHTVQVVCRNTPLAAERCAAGRLSAAAQACGSELKALARYVKRGDMDALGDRLERADSRLAKRIARAESKQEGVCPDGGGLPAARSALTGIGLTLLEFANGLDELGPCEAAKLQTLGKKCARDLKAWQRLAKRGEPGELERTLANSDARFEKAWARAGRHQCSSTGEREDLRLLIDDAVESLAAGEALELGPGHAVLLRPVVTFLPGEREKRLYLPVPASGELIFDEGVHGAAFDRTGNLLGVGGEVSSAFAPNAAALPLVGPADHVSIRLRRSGDLRETLLVPTPVAFDEPALVFDPVPPFDAMLYSPLRTFPAGEEVMDLPPGLPFESFDEWVAEEWGWLYEEGLPAISWLALSELPWALCPAGAPGATPPTGSAHSQNECGISTFIHSFETKFPGALPADVTTNPTSWDVVGDLIGHSNDIGNAGTIMTVSVNTSMAGWRYRGQGAGKAPDVTRVPAPSRTRDGKFYCADRISDVSPANLAAWAEDCNLRLLVYDVVNPANLRKPFGHYADVNKVTPDPADPTKATLELQDYAMAYDVAYDADAGTGLFSGNPAVDFGVDPRATGSVMQGNFGAANAVCGDARDESVYLYVVCECDRTVPLEPTLPTTTKSGKALSP